MRQRVWMLILSVMVAGFAACTNEEENPPPSCGASGESCCETTPTCDSNLVCTSGTCSAPAAAEPTVDAAPSPWDY